MDPLKPRQWGVLLAVARRVVPQVADLDVAGQAAFRRIIADALDLRPEGVRRQFRLFLAVISVLGLLCAGRPFARLDPERQDALLRALQESRVRTIRSGFWGLKTLIFMGYYAQPAVAPRLRYTPSPAGNEMLRA